MAKDTTIEHPCFLCWLAGFIDGEGCFYISRERRLTFLSYAARLVVRMRVDEKPALDEIVRRTGLGHVTVQRAGATAFSPIPHAVWAVGAKRDCAKLVALLEAHPLHAKKRRDFAIWAEAVRDWQTKRYTGNRVLNDWSVMARLKGELEAVRTSGLDGSAPIPKAAEAEHQLSLPDR